MKTYTARNPADALALVRGDLGHDAVVLRTRTYKRGGLFGFPALGGRPVVELTAVSLSVLKAAAKRREEKGRATAPGESLPAGVHRSLGDSATGLKLASAPTAGDLIRRTYAAARMDLGEPGAAAAAAAALADPTSERRPDPRTVADFGGNKPRSAAPAARAGGGGQPRAGQRPRHRAGRGEGPRRPRRADAGAGRGEA